MSWRHEYPVQTCEFIHLSFVPRTPVRALAAAPPSMITTSRSKSAGFPGVSGWQCLDFPSCPAACTADTGPFSWQGACRPERKRLPCRFCGRNPPGSSKICQGVAAEGDGVPLCIIYRTATRPSRHRCPQGRPARIRSRRWARSCRRSPPGWAVPGGPDR